MVPIKVNVFCWRMFLDRLPTRVNLTKKGMDVPSILCLVSDLMVEDVIHLFFSCPFPKAMIEKILVVGFGRLFFSIY